MRFYLRDRHLSMAGFTFPAWVPTDTLLLVAWVPEAVQKVARTSISTNI